MITDMQPLGLKLDIHANLSRREISPYTRLSHRSFREQRNLGGCLEPSRSDHYPAFSRKNAYNYQVIYLRCCTLYLKWLMKRISALHQTTDKLVVYRSLTMIPCCPPPRYSSSPSHSFLLFACRIGYRSTKP